MRVLREKSETMAGRALVLGSGGITGIAWELGMLAGLAESGIDLCDADLVVGTSAGSVVGAQVTSGAATVAELYETQLAEVGPSETAARMSNKAMAQLAWATVRSRDPQTARARMGKMALNTPTVPESERRRVMESLLRSHTWPEQRLLITAADARSGEFIAFDRDSGVELVDAVAASCAVPGVWPPMSVDGRRWIDGGMRSAANADLARGYGRVVVLAPMTGGVGPIARLADQVAELRKHAYVAVMSPDSAARKAIGRNVLDPARRAPAARAGRVQAVAAAAAATGVWSA